MMDPTDKDTKHIKDRSRGTEEYLEYTKENEKGKVNQLDVGNKKDQHNNYKTRTWVRYKVKRQQNIAGNQNRKKQKGHKW